MRFSNSSIVRIIHFLSQDFESPHEWRIDERVPRQIFLGIIKSPQSQRLAHAVDQPRSHAGARLLDPHIESGIERAVVDRQGVRYENCDAVELPYGRQLIADIRDRSETAMPQWHAFLYLR